MIKTPLSWLQDYVDITLPPHELADKLTLAGLEVEHIEYIGVPLPASVRRRKGLSPDDPATGMGHIAWEPDKLLVGQILETSRHPNADRLLLATVDFGQGQPMTIITGAPNLAPGDAGLKIAFATLGATLVDPYADGFKTMKLKPNKIRGIESQGMACSEKELGLSEEHEGILLLPDDAPVGAPLVDYLGDVVFHIAVTPNLIRIASIIGVAREIAAITGASLHIPMPGWPPTWQTRPIPASDFCEVEIVDADLCYRFTATILRDLQLKPSPFWMQRRLRLAGQRPINNLVDVTNYVMFEWGKPLHSFDYDKLLARAQSQGEDIVRIIVRRANEGEAFTTLDNQKRVLDSETLMICDAAGPVAIGGVMGGQDTEISETTTNVLLESASFNFINIRRTALKQKLPSEAAYRFSRGVPSELDPIGNVRGAALMAELGGGWIASGIVEDYARPQPRVEIPISSAEVRRVLGLDLSLDEIAAILRRLEFDLRVEGEAIWATQPYYRLDCTIPADLLEEIARIYGYDAIPVTLLADDLPPQRHNWPLEQEEFLRDVLSGAGLQETINYSLTTVENHARLYPGRPDLAPTADRFITLSNPISPEREVLRRSLVVSTLENLGRGLRHDQRLATFEIGAVYLPEGGDGELPLEERRLCLAMTGPRLPAGWLGGEPKSLDFYDLKGVLETLCDRLHAGPIVYQPAQEPSFGPRCARILLDGQVLGVVGELHPTVRAAFDLPAQPVVIADLALDPLLPFYQRAARLRPFSDFPPVKEDIALVVDEAIPAAQVEALIRQTAGEALVDLVLFDLYRGKPIPPGKKSLAFALTFQSPTKTLTDDDTAKLRKKIIGRLEREIGATLRAG
ncbi:MAG: phenylalanine--tRNA ligase subunit beta [Caldilineales bacterium]|nr:phenylalanine--tRNA ligase subunit beta [Caldilineales bacterium]